LPLFVRHWKDWDGEQRARCLLHLALSTLPPGQVFVSGPEVNARALGLSEPEMREWVALVAPLLPRDTTATAVRFPPARSTITRNAPSLTRSTCTLAASYTLTASTSPRPSVRISVTVPP
jgi:hypothetical protein